MGNRKEIDLMGKRILNYVRNELFLSMHFMGPALSGLDLIMDLSTKTVGTDAVYIRYNPSYLMTVWLEHPWVLDRTWMHMLVHCLFRHMYSAKEHSDTQLWDLCADIAAEAVVDSIVEQRAVFSAKAGDERLIVAGCTGVEHTDRLLVEFLVEAHDAEVDERVILRAVDFDAVDGSGGGMMDDVIVFPEVHGAVAARAVDGHAVNIGCAHRAHHLIVLVDVEEFLCHAVER